MQIGQTWATLVRDVWFFIYWTSGTQPRAGPGRTVHPINDPRKETSAKRALRKQRSGAEDNKNNTEINRL